MSTRDLEDKLRDAAAEVFGQRQIVLTLRQSVAERDALIAELVTALKETLDYWTSTGFAECAPDCDCVVESVRAAIEKAAPLLEAPQNESTKEREEGGAR